MTGSDVTSRKTAGANRDVTVNIRASRQVLDKIDQAAAALGKNRSGFMLEHALRAAEHVILEKTLFPLGKSDFAEFVAGLDAPPSDNPKLRALLKRIPAWDRQPSGSDDPSH